MDVMDIVSMVRVGSSSVKYANATIENKITRVKLSLSTNRTAQNRT